VWAHHRISPPKRAVSGGVPFLIETCKKRGGRRSASRRRSIGHIKERPLVNRKQRRATEKSAQAATGARARFTEEGMRWQREGRLDRARALYLKALAADPHDAEALHRLGVLCVQEGDPSAGVEWIAKSIAISPYAPAPRNNLGVALAALGRFEEAVEAYGAAIAIEPGHVDALNNRGNALCELNRQGEALASYDRALAIQPNDAEVLNNRANALCALDRHADALAGYDRALAILPNYAHALNNRANAMRALNRHEEAIADFQRLLKAQPDYDYARGALLDAKLYCCDWRDYAELVEPLRKAVVAGRRAASPFAFLAVSGSPSEQLQCAQTYADHKFPTSKRPPGDGARYRHDRIRVAYLSADFRHHPLSHLMMGLFEAHDATRFETIAMSYGPDSEDETRKRLKSAFERFIDVRGQSDGQTALLLRQLEIDIAVDLTGYTLYGRPGILTSRPSPVQVNYLGYSGTMSADHIDYIIADPTIIPGDQQAFYTEKIVYLPDSFMAQDSNRAIAPTVPTRREAGLPERGFVFCCFNNNYKITPPVFDVWMRLLLEVEGSVLWLFGSNEAATRNLRRSAEMRGVAADRLVFAPLMKLEDYIARHRLADLFLDTAPYNAHSTAAYALWGGLPVLTRSGSSFAANVAGSLLKAVGLTELIAGDLESYAAMALRLARDESALAAIRAKLARNRLTFPLFDTDRFRRNIESAYHTMWERSQRGAPPAGFAVAEGR
jgi:protein O-GlcNAc transferase